MAAQKDLGAPVPDYQDEKVSGKVAAILQSYATQDIPEMRCDPLDSPRPSAS